VIGVVPTMATTSSVVAAGDCVTVFCCCGFGGVAVELLTVGLGEPCIGGGKGAGAGASLFPQPARPIATGNATINEDKTTVVRCDFNGVTSVNESMYESRLS
jgi:hypothetical protein